MNSELDKAINEGIRERVRECVRIAGSGDALSRMTGIPRRTLENYLSGRSKPPASAAWAIAAILGVSADWLLGGRGPMRHSDQPAAPPASGSVPANLPPVTVNSLEDEIFGELYAEISKLYETRGVRIPPAAFGALVSEKAKEIAAAHSDPDLQRAMIPLIIVMLDKELRAGTGKTDGGKRSA